MGVSMKFATPLVSVFALVGFVVTSSAVDYADLVAKGYRWSSVEGPYACPAKEDARKILARPSSSTDLDQSDRVRAYYLIPGMVVLVLETDASSGLSRIRAGGITADLWTATKYLSSRPIRNTLGVIETPDTVSIVSSSSPQPSATPSPLASPGIAPTATPSQ
jgi:hypothetical protein